MRLEVKHFSKKTKRTFYSAQEVVLVLLSRKMNSPFRYVKSLGQLRPPCWILCFHRSTNAHQGPKIVTIPHNNSETPSFVVFLSSIWIFLREWISNEIIWKQALCYHGSNDRILFSRQKVTVVVVAPSGLSAKMLGWRQG